ncbi:MAG: hypothetical protein HYV35_02930 [Lentisphaerae bacterium]|nr:hypothetical protein [Lentisphaerota bacterium]
MRIGELTQAGFWLGMFPLLLAAQPTTVTIRDYIGGQWQDELVHYSLDFREGSLKGIARAGVKIADGKAIPAQVSDVKRHKDGSIRSFNVWFFADIPEGEAVSYTITPGETGPEDSGITATATVAFIELTTRAPKKIGIRLPAGGNEYNWPVPAREAPGPIQALLLPSGRWIGKGRFEAPFEVKSYKAEVTAAGPLFAEARVHYIFDTGYWTFTARVLKNCPMIIIEEELNTGYSGQQWDKADRFYSLILNSGGFKPTQGFYTSGFTDKEEFHTLLKQEAQAILKESSGHIAASAGTKVNGYTLSFKEDRDDYYLTPWPTWSARANTIIRFVEPGKDAVGFAALNVVKWRDPLSLRFKSNLREELSLNLPLQVYEQGWPSEGFGRYSPNATGKALYVPENTARRHYGIMLSEAENELTNKLHSLIHQSVKLGSHSLDEVKDWILDWPDPLSGAKWAQESTATGQSALQLMRQWRDWKRALGHFGLFSMWNHRSLTHMRYEPVRSVIDSKDALTAAERRELRRLCAYQAYVLNSLEHFPWGVGCHLGNPNMSIMAVDARTKASLLVKDHPMFKEWGAWTLAFTKDYIRRYTRETGAPYENPHYTLGVTLSGILQANKVFMENGIGDALDTELFRRHARFLMDWLTIPDPRFQGHRLAMGIGNGGSYNSFEPEAGRLLVEYYRERDPEFAANLQWFVNQTLPGEKQIKVLDQEKAPVLTSVHHQDYGVIFRHGYGTPYETLFHIMAGNCNGHYEAETDQMAYTLYAKGQPISLHFANGYHPMFNRPWLRNRVSIDHKFEIAERHATKTLCAAFTPEADYMRAARDIDRIRPMPGEYPRLEVQGLNWSDEELQAWRYPPPAEDIPLTTWHRQMLFLKDADPKGPNYFVLRDAFGSTPTRPTDLSLWFLANAMERKGNVFHYDGQCLVDLDVFVVTPETFEPETGKYGHAQYPYRRYTGFDPKYFPDGKLREDQLFLRIKQPPGKGYMVVLYPRLKQNDPAAVFTRLAENAVKIETPLSVDYAFLSPHPFTYHDAKLTFKGMAGTVRFYKSGKIAVANCEGKTEIAVAGKTITGAGGFVVTLEGGKVVSSTTGKDAKFNVGILERQQ